MCFTLSSQPLMYWMTVAFLTWAGFMYGSSRILLNLYPSVTHTMFYFGQEFMCFFFQRPGMWNLYHQQCWSMQVYSWGLQGDSCSCRRPKATGQIPPGIVYIHVYFLFTTLYRRCMCVKRSVYSCETCTQIFITLIVDILSTTKNLHAYQNM